MKHTELDTILFGYKQELLDTLKSWIQIPSVKADALPGAPFGEPVRQMLAKALFDSARFGFETHDIDGYAGEAILGEGDQTLGVLVHLDVVPEGDGWKHPPYGGEMEGSVMFGRGTSDNKGPAVAALFALRAIREAGIPLKHQIKLIYGCDEESGWEDIRYYKTKRTMPDYGFSPDAGFPLYNAEKGILHLSVKAPVQDRRLIALEGGSRPNVVPGTAGARIAADVSDVERAIQALGLEGKVSAAPGQAPGEVTIASTGMSAHGSAPHLGINAAGQLLILLSALGIGGDPISLLAQDIGMTGDGQGLGIASADEASGPLTLNLGVISFKDSMLTAQLDIRHPVTISADWVFETLSKSVEKGGFAAEVSDRKAPLYIPADHPLITTLLSVYEAFSGLPGYPMSMGGGTYARALSNAVAFGASFPGDETCAHMPDEYIDTDKLMLSARIIMHAMVALAGKEE